MEEGADMWMSPKEVGLRNTIFRALQSSCKKDLTAAEVVCSRPAEIGSVNSQSWIGAGLIRP